MENHSKSETFSLGITMAGAVSAGCYTAGVMDYLFEILDLWEKAKDGKVLTEFSDIIPKHCVKIDAMGGTSAGGMTTTISAIYALNGSINPVTKPERLDEVKNNILYDSWVLMDDHNKSDTRPLFEKLLDTDDLEEGVFGSLLNSKFIDTIADQAFYTSEETHLEKKTKELPSYLSKDLQLLYSHCFLRGIPLDVNFETSISKYGRKSVIPNHSTFEHYIVTQYHLNNGIKPDTEKYLWLNPYDKPYSDVLKLSTIATGAFPIGLAFREFKTEHLGDEYLKTTIKRIITGEFGLNNPKADNIKLKYFPKNYSSVAIDGGAINNEPYREVLSILQHQNGDDFEDGYPRYGVIMIDPFPDRAQSKKSYSKPNDAVDVAQGIIGTLMDQSRIKRREMLETDSSKYFKSIIFPRKWRTNKENKIIGPPGTITCASAMAFGGFLDRRFRQHDFFLGRNNARNFLRYFYSFPYDKEKGDIHPIHRCWTDQMADAFKFEKKKGSGKFYLPIIPDLHLLSETETERITKRNQYDIPKTPIYDPEELFKLENKIKKRFRKIFTVLQERDFSEAVHQAKAAEFETLTTLQKNAIKRAEQKNLIAEKWIQKKYGPNGFSKIGAFISTPFLKLGMFFAKRVAAKKIARIVISEILKDLASKGLLKK